MSSIVELYDVLQGEDDLGVVVRSHIVVEQRLNAFVEALMYSVDHLKKMDLDYHQTVRLAIALGLNARFEQPLNALGTIRNGFAHNLRPEISKQDANNLYQSLSSEDKQILQKSLKNTKRELPEENLGAYRTMSPKEQFSFNVVVLFAALDSAIGQLPNQ